MASKKPQSATGDNGAKYLAKPAGERIAELSILSTGMSSRSATDIVRALSETDGAEHLVARLSEPALKVALQLPDMSKSVQVSLPHPIQDSYQQQNRKTEDEKAMVSPASRGADVADVIVSPSDIGSLVRRARETRNLSQQSFADLAGVGRRFLSELENGKPTLELGKVLKVTRAAGISLFARQR